jgi:hypothetical protein
MFTVKIFLYKTVLPKCGGFFVRNEKQLLRDLKKVIELDNGNEAMIAYKLGYKSNLTPRMWLNRESIPSWCLNRLDSVLNEFFSEKEGSKL